MKKKYIIELEDGVTLWGFFTDTDGKIAVVGVIKQPYAEPDLEQVRIEAYEHGQKDLREKIEEAYDCGHDEGYKVGLSDAWEAARGVGHCKLWGDYTKDTGTTSVCAVDVLDYYSAYEAIKKLKAYERKKQEEIKVGDEVVFGNDEEIKAVVIDEADEAGVWLLLSENGCVERMDGVLFHRTGRHFSELTEIFKKMREE